MKTFFFISGLPRSGSTLLSSILKQNPDFYADISSPVEGLCTTSIDLLTGCESNSIVDEKRRIVLKLGEAAIEARKLSIQQARDSSKKKTRKRRH